MDGARPAVLRAADYYLPPPSLPADAWDLLAPAERIIAWYEQRVGRRLPRPSGLLFGHTVYVRIDAGRWVADCPCGSAQVVSVTDPRMFCVECLTGWHQLIVPADPAAAEQAVAWQPAHARFWWQDGDTTSWNRPSPPAGEKQPAPVEPPPLEEVL
jgi:hypothetical protein